MKLSILSLKLIPFLWRLGRVRSGASEGKFNAARQKLARIQAPKAYLALKEAYDVRLASIAYAANVTFEGLETHPPDEMLNLISKIQTHRWYWAPINDNERYSARYVDYVEAAILGDGNRRRELARELAEAPADKFFKDTLVAI